MDSDGKFGSKKSIKRQFDHDISRFGNLDLLHRLSLVLGAKTSTPNFVTIKTNLRQFNRPIKIILYIQKTLDLAYDPNQILKCNSF